MKAKLFWLYSVLGALFGGRRSEIKVLQVTSSLSQTEPVW